VTVEELKEEVRGLRRALKVTRETRDGVFADKDAEIQRLQETVSHLRKLLAESSPAFAEQERERYRRYEVARAEILDKKQRTPR
jgi:hypothetical protein